MAVVERRQSFASLAPVLEPVCGARVDDRRTSKVGNVTVKAAPADEARAVRHTTHREV